MFRTAEVQRRTSPRTGSVLAGALVARLPLLAALLLPGACTTSSDSAPQPPACVPNASGTWPYCEPATGCCAMRGFRYALDGEHGCKWTYTAAAHGPEMVECFRVDESCPVATAGRCYQRQRNGLAQVVMGISYYQPDDLKHSDWALCPPSLTLSSLPDCTTQAPAW